MIGQPTTMPDLKSITIGAAAALVSAICLIAPAAAQADGLRAPEMDTVNGQPCNTLCKAYMAWSDRVLAVTQPSYVRPQVRVAVPQNPTPKKLEKPERMANHAPKSTRPSNLDSFAQLPSGAHAAQSGMDMRRGDDTLGEYGNVTMGRPLPDDPISPAALARLHGTSPEPDMRLVSMSGMDAQGSRTVGEGSGASPSNAKFLSFLLALGALMAFFARGWFKQRARAPEPFN